MSATILNLLATNEFSESAVTTQSAVILSSGQEIYRQFNIPGGWTKLKLLFKAALYCPVLPNTNLSTTRFIAGICSSGRSFAQTGNQHIVGSYFSHDSLTPLTWEVNGDGAGGGGSGSYNTQHTIPPGCAWQCSSYGNRTFSYVTGSLKGQGSTGGYNNFPIYNTVWSSSYVNTVGYPLHSLLGNNWGQFCIEFTKNSSLNGTTIVVSRMNAMSAPLSTIGGTVNNWGFNPPRIVSRRAALQLQYGTYYPTYTSWLEYFRGLTGGAGGSDSAAGGPWRIDESAYGPLDTVTFNWTTATAGVQMAIRDVVIVKVEN